MVMPEYSLAMKVAKEARCAPNVEGYTRMPSASCMVEEMLVASRVDVEDLARIFIGSVENRKPVTAPVLLV